MGAYRAGPKRLSSSTRSTFSSRKEGTSRPQRACRLFMARPSGGNTVPISSLAHKPSASSHTQLSPIPGKIRAEVSARATSRTRLVISPRASSSSAPESSVLVSSCETLIHWVRSLATRYRRALSMATAAARASIETVAASLVTNPPGLSHR